MKCQCKSDKSIFISVSPNPDINGKYLYVNADTLLFLPPMKLHLFLIVRGAEKSWCGQGPGCQ